MMMKSSLCIFTIAVLLGGATSDFICIIRQLFVVTPDHFFSTPFSSCQNVETKFIGARKELKKCSRYEIDTSSLESLYGDFCTLSSDYRQKFDRQKRCLSRNVHNIKRCSEDMRISPSLNPYALTKKSQIDMCSSLSHEVSRCLKLSVGKPCGPEGLEVYGRIAEASEPFFKGICLDAAQSALGHTEPEDEVVTAESGIVEVAVAEGASTDVKSEQYAGAAAHTAFFWCIILGLLFTAKW